MKRKVYSFYSYKLTTRIFSPYCINPASSSKNSIRTSIFLQVETSKARMYVFWNTFKFCSFYIRNSNPLRGSETGENKSELIDIIIQTPFREFSNTLDVAGSQGINLVSSLPFSLSFFLPYIY